MTNPMIRSSTSMTLTSPTRLSPPGKRMRHVKLTPGDDVDATALAVLIDAAYADIKRRIGAE